jgi:hypothetical protein
MSQCTPVQQYNKKSEREKNYLFKKYNAEAIKILQNYGYNAHIFFWLPSLHEKKCKNCSIPYFIRSPFSTYTLCVYI